MSWGALAGAAIGALGNWLGSNAQSDALEAQRQQEHADAMDAIRRQEEFAKHGLQWRIDDARAAGVHPLYALGANVSAPSPVTVGSSANLSRSDFIKDTGQNLSRAVQQTLENRDQELMKLQLATAQADLDGKLIDNQYRASQLRQLNSVGTSFPTGDFSTMDGQGVSEGLIAPRIQGARPVDAPWAHYGEQPDVDWSRTKYGRAPQIPERLAESMEDSWVQRMLWYMRNLVVPNVSPELAASPPKSELPKGYDRWVWDRVNQEWVPGRRYYEYDKTAGAVNRLFGGGR